MSTPAPLRVAIVNDYEVVVAGLARMLAPYADRVRVVEIAANESVAAEVDVALFDTFARVGENGDGPLDGVVDGALENARRQKLVVYSWSADRRRLENALGTVADAYLPKGLPAAELVAALESIHAGTWRDPAHRAEVEREYGDWPGRVDGLSERESEVISLIVQGLSNEQVADRAFLSINTVKSYIRTSYRKMGVTTRSQAVLWGVDHGFQPDRVRVRAHEDDDAL